METMGFSLAENFEGKNNFGDPDVDGRMLLKQVCNNVE
jgi:hypothetical protein